MRCGGVRFIPASCGTPGWYHGTSVFEDFKFDWEMVKQGFRDYHQRYPASTIDEQFAQLSCYQGDRAVAREAFALFEKASASIWSGDEVDFYRRWAQDHYLSGDQLAVYEGLRVGQSRLDWIADGTQWLVFDNDSHLVFWDAATGRHVKRFEVPLQVWTAVLDASGKSVLAAEFRRSRFQVDLETGVLQRLGEHERILGTAMSPDGTQYATTGRDRKVRFWNVEDKGLAETWETKPMTVQGLAFSPDGAMSLPAHSTAVSCSGIAR